MLKIKTDLNNKLDIKEETVAIKGDSLSVSDSKGLISSIDMKDVERAFVEEGLGIGKLVVKDRNGNEKEIAYFTKRKVKNFRKFADALNQYVKTKKLVNVGFEEKRPKGESMTTLRWLFGFTKGHRKMLALGILLSLVAVFLSLIPPYLLKVLVDNVILSQAHSILLLEELVVVLIAAFCASRFVALIQNYILNKTGNKIVTALRSRLFKHAVKLSATDIDNVTPAGYRPG